MKKVSQEIYHRIDNELYHAERSGWWEPDSALYLIQTSLNPARVAYARRKLFTELTMDPRGKRALEVGCGGGILCEEIARMGFEVTGIDPSEPSLKVAVDHARKSGLSIAYDGGTGEALPYRDQSFDVVFCCDVLEHVRDLPQVVSEIARVLKGGGVFCYDTINRTLMSKVVAVKISQEWKRWAFAPPNLHVWEMFITPEEMASLLDQNRMRWKDHRGLVPNLPWLGVLRCLRLRAKGKLSYRDLGEKLRMVESDNLNIMYIGYAIKDETDGAFPDQRRRTGRKEGALDAVGIDQQ